MTVKHPRKEHPRNQILYGPPGTGKTWRTVDYALAIIDGAPVGSDIERKRKRLDKLRFKPAANTDDADTGQIAMVTFHQNFAYEDFIEGIRPRLDGDGGGIAYELRDGIFKRLAKDAPDTGDAQ